MKPARLRFGREAIELLEEAFHLLRQTPGATLLTYFAGTLPFVLGLLFFWFDMARGVDAGDHLVAGATGLTVLFLWMKLEMKGSVLLLNTWVNSLWIHDRYYQA